MLEEFLKNKELGSLLSSHAGELIKFLCFKGIGFDILVNMNFVNFNPDLPEDIKPNEPMVLFALGGYTLSSVRITGESLEFHAGFGANDFESVVSMPLKAIVRISLEKAVLFVNFSIPAQNEVEKSTNIFKQNPKNKNIFGE